MNHPINPRIADLTPIPGTTVRLINGGISRPIRANIASVLGPGLQSPQVEPWSGLKVPKKRCDEYTDDDRDRIFNLAQQYGTWLATLGHSACQLDWDVISPTPSFARWLYDTLDSKAPKWFLPTYADGSHENREMSVGAYCVAAGILTYTITAGLRDGMSRGGAENPVVSVWGDPLAKNIQERHIAEWKQAARWYQACGLLCPTEYSWSEMSNADHAVEAAVGMSDALGGKDIALCTRLLTPPDSNMRASRMLAVDKDDYESIFEIAARNWGDRPIILYLWESKTGTTGSIDWDARVREGCENLLTALRQVFPATPPTRKIVDLGERQARLVTIRRALAEVAAQVDELQSEDQ